MSRRFILFVCLASLILVHAHERTTSCIIISGKAENELAMDLMEYNRIYFGQETMTLSNPDNPEADIQLFYSEYNRLQFGPSNPNVNIEEAEAESFRFMYLKEEQTLNLTTSDETIEIGIFNLSGSLIARSQSKQTSVSRLPSGTYIAIAIGENQTYTVKFVK